MMKEVLIFSEKSSPRLAYVVDLIFREILSLAPKIISKKDDFDVFEGLKYQYIPKLSLLFEDNITHQNEDVLKDDALALAFYIATCYQEYLPDLKRDVHSRPCFDEMILVKNSWEKFPKVHEIAYSIASEIGCDLSHLERKYQCIPTFDIDIAYASKGKPFFRFVMAFLRSLLQRNFVKTKELCSAVTDSSFQDPFDTFDFILKSCKKKATSPLFFNLTSSYSKYDKNLPSHSKALKQLIIKLDCEAEVALHPSYFVNAEILSKEKKNLEKLTQRKIDKSRQHFLKVNFPTSFENLIKEGFTDDYSLGFHDRAGFRTGMCIPFYWFHLTKNEMTSLRLHPLIFMDTYLLKNSDKQEAILQELSEISDEVRKYKGNMIPLWHNMLLYSEEQKELFIKSLTSFVG